MCCRDWIGQSVEQAGPHRIRAAIVFLLVFFGAGILLPVVRRYPRDIHEYFAELSPWLRILFAFFLCTLLVLVIFRMLAPRGGHLVYWKSHPPAWLAALVAWFVVAIVDCLGGFDPNGYRASVGEWFSFGILPILIIGAFTGFWLEVAEVLRNPKETKSPCEVVNTIKDIKKASWDEIATWLRCDEPARYDLLGNQSVADRVAKLIAEGIRSIGIVGPFGAGKTSICTWVKERLTSREWIAKELRETPAAVPHYLIVRHSCWGFESSSSAIRDMLSSAIDAIRSKIDTFQVDSLPEAYLQVFLTGEGWVKAVSSLLLRSVGPMEQFQRLSSLLTDIDSRVVFFVEDLDRADTRGFEIQEVLAFLERVKVYPNLHFVLTGGFRSTCDIDYARLCDHNEYLKSVEPKQVSELVGRVRERCLDEAVFQCVGLSDVRRSREANPFADVGNWTSEEVVLPEAIALLLNTPRALRHALERTYSSWPELRGEVDFDRLLAINVLRCGAPSCFQFLLRRWSHLKSRPQAVFPMFQHNVEAVKIAIRGEWGRIVGSAEWNAAAALKVMEFALPATMEWLADRSSGVDEGSLQGLHEERYWRRAVNEAIDTGEVRDRQVIEETRDWIANPRSESPLIESLCSSEAFGEAWKRIAVHFLGGERDLILALCEQVLRRIGERHGAAASASSCGFNAVLAYVRQNVRQEDANVQWLQQRISEAADVSLTLVYDLWYELGRENNFIECRRQKELRQYCRDETQRVLTDGNALIARLHPKESATLYRLVFDLAGTQEPVPDDLREWSWLGPAIVQAIRTRDIRAVANCGVLLGERKCVDRDVLTVFFGSSAAEVFGILSEIVDRLPVEDQTLVRNVLMAAKSCEEDL